MGFMMSFLVSYGQKEEISKRVSPNDSLNVTVKFEKVKLSQQETTAQAELNALLSNSLTTTGVLSRSVDRLATAVEENMKLSRISKTELVAHEIGVSPDRVKQAFRLNSTFKLISLIPIAIIIMISFYKFLVIKDLDVKSAIQGTTIMTIYGLVGAIVLYMLLSLIFNNQYFVIKDLMRSMF